MRSWTRTLLVGVGAAAGLRLLYALRGADLDSKVVLITGGSRGLGLELARVFAKRGARLALLARDPEELQRAQAELRERGAHVEIFTCDVGAEHEVDEAVRRAAESFGGLDVVVNVAGIIQVAPFDAVSLEDLHAAMDANFWGTVHTTFAALPFLRAQGGRVVNITSIGGAVAVPHLLSYSASKFAALGFSLGMANELRAHGIKVTTVLPGLMRTGSTGHAMVKGQREKESALFTVAGSLPLLTMSSARAARRIVRGCERGERYVVVGVPAKLLRLASALFPSATTAAMQWVSGLLPGGGGASPSERASMAREHRAAVPRLVTALNDAAAERNNEKPVLH